MMLKLQGKVNGNASLMKIVKTFQRLMSIINEISQINFLTKYINRRCFGTVYSPLMLTTCIMGLNTTRDKSFWNIRIKLISTTFSRWYTVQGLEALGI